MITKDIQENGLFLMGCGKMGSAMLHGWLTNGLAPSSVWVEEPFPSDWLHEQAQKGLHLNVAPPAAPAVALLAVKPQTMDIALAKLAPICAKSLVISVAAGVRIAAYEKSLPKNTRIIRAMPNTPAAIGKGITAIIGNHAAQPKDIDLAEGLLSIVGPVVRLENEAWMDGVTALSGSGPAYVFHMIEAMARAGQAEGLPEDLAIQLARETISGAGALVAQSSEISAADLRRNVTSPGGTTAAALDVLMQEETGLTALMKRAIHAAAERSRALGT